MDLQQASLPCPSLSLRVYRKLYPLSRCCHPTISSSVTTFSSCLQSFPASGSFTVNQLFISRGQNIGASASVLPMNIQCRFPSGLTGLISLLSKRLSRIPAPQFESINSLALNLLYGPARTCIHDCWKKHSFASYRPLSVKWYLCFLVCCLGLSLNTLTIVILIFVQTYPITKFPVSLFPLLIFFLTSISVCLSFLNTEHVCERVEMSLEPLKDTVLRRLCFLIRWSGKSRSL